MTYLDEMRAKRVERIREIDANRAADIAAGNMIELRDCDIRRIGDEAFYVHCETGSNVGHIYLGEIEAMITFLRSKPAALL